LKQTTKVNLNGPEETIGEATQVEASQEEALQRGTIIL
jgi:hypothetical protein